MKFLHPNLNEYVTINDDQLNKVRVIMNKTRGLTFVKAYDAFKSRTLEAFI